MVTIRWLETERSKCLKSKTFGTFLSVNLSINLQSKVHLALKSKELAWSGSTIIQYPDQLPKRSHPVRIWWISLT